MPMPPLSDGGIAMPTAVRPPCPTRPPDAPAAGGPPGKAGSARPEGPVPPARKGPGPPSGPAGCARPEGFRPRSAPAGGWVRAAMRNPRVSPVANKPQIWNPAT
ncbi:hypothetical protein SAMN04487916_1132 [Arthrobacter sp. ov407]|nr:hypothetical protein SAMN04487916_1132 [Arthrobacter sp. ov407]